MMLAAVLLSAFGVFGCGGSASHDLGVSLSRQGSVDYEDADDGGISQLGRPASPSERNAIIALARRYVAAAAVADGKAVCRLLHPTVVRSLVYFDGVDPGGHVRRGACARTAGRMLHEARTGRLTSYAVTGVRLEGGEAYVLLNSPTQPASYLTAHRDRVRWAIDMVLIPSLP